MRLGHSVGVRLIQTLPLCLVPGRDASSEAAMRQGRNGRRTAEINQQLLTDLILNHGRYHPVRHTQLLSIRGFENVILNFRITSGQ